MNKMHLHTTKLISLMLACSLLIQVLLAGTSFAAPAEEGKSTAVFDPKLQSALTRAENIVSQLRPFPDAAAIGFLKNGRAVPAGYLESTADQILDSRGIFSKVTDLTRIALGYAAAGGSLNDIAGIDLHPILLNHPGMVDEGVPGLTQAYIMSYNSSSTGFERVEWYPDAIYFELMARQSDDGSWSMDVMETGSSLATALVMNALGSTAFGYLNLSDSKPLQDALQWLEASQRADGGFEDGLTGTTAQVIIALSTIGIDAAAFAREDGRSPLEHLLARQLSGGGFTQNGSSSVLDIDATVQAYLALTAYKLSVQAGDKLYINLNHPSHGQAYIQIEGPEGTLAEGKVNGGKAEEVLHAFFEEKGVEYEWDKTKSEFAFSSIGGIPNGKFGGQDQWQYAFESDGSWRYPKNGFVLEQEWLSHGSRLLIYYSDNTELIDTMLIEWKMNDNQMSQGNPIPEVPFDLYIKKSNSQLGYLPAAGVTVTVRGQSAITNKEGKVSLAKLPPGRHAVTMTKYREGAAPAIAKSVRYITVSSPELSSFADEASAANWARYDLAYALLYGYIQGVSAQPSLLAPKKQLTRAEFAAMLLRLLNETVDSSADSGFSDVAPDQWYSGTVAKAAELGIVDRSLTRFEPNRAITREEAAVMAANAGRLSTFGSASRMPYSDVSTLSAASKKAIQAVYEYDVMTGSSGKFHPHQILVREQAAAILMRLHNHMYKWIHYQ